MVEGDKWEMYIPSELGYGDGGSGWQFPSGLYESFLVGPFDHEDFLTTTPKKNKHTL